MAHVPADVTAESLRLRYVGALRYGSFMTIDLSDSGVDLHSCFCDDGLPEAVLDRDAALDEGTWGPLLRPDAGDPPRDRFVPRDDFRLVCVCSSAEPPPATAAKMHVVWVQQPAAGAGAGAGAGCGADDGEDALEAMFGVKEVKRNSKDLVEAAFDGDDAEIDAWLEKGYHVDSTDAHDNSALSEASCQGHTAVVTKLLKLGADPNFANDIGKTPLHRAAFNNHMDTVQLLLQSGADPDARDKSLEVPFDVTSSAPIRDALSAWDRARTAELRQQRDAVIRQQREDRLRSAADREAAAVAAVRAELLQLAMDGQTDDLKAALTRQADDAVAEGRKRPRANARIRDDRGNTLLALAAWHGHVATAEMLLTHHNTLSETLEEMEHKAFQCGDVNARDMKGWTPIALACFHGHPKVAALLLEHGAQPTLKNRFGKNCFAILKDAGAEDGDTVAAQLRDVLAAWGVEHGYSRPDWEEAPAACLAPGGGGGGGAAAVKAKGKAKVKAAAPKARKRVTGAGKSSATSAAAAAPASKASRGGASAATGGAVRTGAGSKVKAGKATAGTAMKAGVRRTAGGKSKAAGVKASPASHK